MGYFQPDVPTKPMDSVVLLSPLNLPKKVDSSSTGEIDSSSRENSSGVKSPRKDLFLIMGDNGSNGEEEKDIVQEATL